MLILTIFRVKKLIFWTFSKLVWSCSEVVWVSFWALKAQLSAVYLALKVKVTLLDVLVFTEKYWESFLDTKQRGSTQGLLELFFGLFESCFGDAHKLILSHFPLLWGPAVALNEKKPKVFDCVGGGGVVVWWWWGVLPFCTLDYVRTIFFKCIGL